MSVHKAITELFESRYEARKKYLQLDKKREQAIEKVLEQAKNSLPFTTTKINQITNEMNLLAKKYNLPPRKNVTKEMVWEYVKKKS